MFIQVNTDKGEIELTAVGSTEMALLRKLAGGVFVQAFDDTKKFANVIIIAPRLLMEVNNEAVRRRY